MKSTTIAMERAASPPGEALRLTASALQERYYDEVFAFFARRIRPREEAEDLTASTFLAAFQNLGKVRKEDPRLFLFGIARRKLADSLRRRRQVALSDETPVDAPDSGASQLAAALREAIRSLPQDQAEALMLQNLEDLSLREIAKVMNRSEKSVKALLQRAKERLRSNSLLKSIAEEIHV